MRYNYLINMTKIDQWNNLSQALSKLCFNDIHFHKNYHYSQVSIQTLNHNWRNILLLYASMIHWDNLRRVRRMRNILSILKWCYIKNTFVCLLLFKVIVNIRNTFWLFEFTIFYWLLVSRTLSQTAFYVLEILIAERILSRIWTLFHKKLHSSKDIQTLRTWILI